MNDSETFQVGDSVVVKPGVMCPDRPAIALAGWQGRVTAIYTEEGTLDIQWDSHTLRAIPDDFVRECEEEGLDWAEMCLDLSEVQLAAPRDATRDVAAAHKEVAARHAWDHLAADNPGIREALAGVVPDDIMAVLEAWEAHLEEALQFPFECEVAELLRRGPLRIGDRVHVTGLADADDLYGLLANVRQGRERFVFPLCDLKVTDKASPNYQPIKDYVVWYANR